MITLIHQPEFMPWLGFFDKLARSDVFVIYDDVQFEKNGFQNRNKILTAHGWKWLSVPIVHNYPELIKDVKISGTDWKKDHLNKITFSYKKAPYFEKYYPLIEDAISANHELLIDLNLHIIRNIANALGIKVKMIRSSEFSYEGKEKNEKLISICKSVGSDRYLVGSGGRSYTDEKMFSDAGIKLLWHDYNHPTYKQQFESFQPQMSTIDLLFNNGMKSKETILNGGFMSENIDNTIWPLIINPGMKSNNVLRGGVML
jgi:hypothetical protein